MKFIDDSDADADDAGKSHDRDYDARAQPEMMQMMKADEVQTNSNGTSIDAGGGQTSVSAAATYKDAGYSWVILGAVMTDYCLVAIGLGAVGVLYPHFIEHFQCTKYEAGWIGSLHMAVGALIGNVPRLLTYNKL
jgi:hypothetical protein